MIIFKNLSRILAHSLANDLSKQLKEQSNENDNATIMLTNQGDLNSTLLIKIDGNYDSDFLIDCAKYFYE